MVSEQLHYTTNREEIFIFSNKKMSYLCGVWRFANAYWYCIMKGTKVILGADKSYKNTNVKKVNAQRAATH